MARRSNLTYPQSGVIAVAFQRSEISILLITSRSNKRWVIPKGLIEENLTPRESAIKEAYEEAGVRGLVPLQPIGEYQYQKWRGTCNVEVFLLEVTDVLPEWPEAQFRRRAWLSVEEAGQRVDEKALRRIIRRVPKLLEQRASE